MCFERSFSSRGILIGGEQRQTQSVNRICDVIGSALSIVAVVRLKLSHDLRCQPSRMCSLMRSLSFDSLLGEFR